MSQKNFIPKQKIKRFNPEINIQRKKGLKRSFLNIQKKYYGKNSIVSRMLKRRRSQVNRSGENEFILKFNKPLSSEPLYDPKKSDFLQTKKDFNQKAAFDTTSKPFLSRSEDKNKYVKVNRKTNSSPEIMMKKNKNKGNFSQINEKLILRNIISRQAAQTHQLSVQQKGGQNLILNRSKQANRESGMKDGLLINGVGSQLNQNLNLNLKSFESRIPIYKIINRSLMSNRTKTADNSSRLNEEELYTNSISNNKVNRSISNTQMNNKANRSILNTQMNNKVNRSILNTQMNKNVYFNSAPVNIVNHEKNHVIVKKKSGNKNNIDLKHSVENFIYKNISNHVQNVDQNNITENEIHRESNLNNSEINQSMNIDSIAEQVYQKLAFRLQIEKERSGDF